MRKKIMIMAAALIAMMSFSVNAQNAKQVPQNKMRQPMEFTEFAFEGILLDVNQQARIDSLNAAVKANAPALKCDKAKKCEKAEGCDKAQKCDKDKKCDKQSCDKAQGCKHDNKCDKAKDDKKCDKGECPKDGKHRMKGLHAQAPMGRCPYGEDYIAKVKEILTPEQYTLFLENIVSMPANFPGHQNIKAQPIKAKDFKACPVEKCDKQKADKKKK